MDVAQLARLAQQILNTQLFTISGQPVTPMTVLTVGILLVVTFVVSSLLRRWIESAFRAKGVDDVGTIQISQRLIHYTMLAIGITIAMDTVGISIGALFAAGAVFAIGLGFAMQNIAQNFVSGLLLIAERSIKPGDIVEVDDRMVRVLRMGIRTTVGRTRDEEEIIIPNSSLVQTSVKNYTLHDPLIRVRSEVGVAYEEDMKAVEAALKKAAFTFPDRLSEREPMVLLTEFGDSSVVWEVFVWTNDPWAVRKARSGLNLAIWWALKDAGITIAFPQLDLHLDPPVSEAFTRLRPAG